VLMPDFHGRGRLAEPGMRATLAVKGVARLGIAGAVL
jgi:hypothetical protein